MYIESKDLPELTITDRQIKNVLKRAENILEKNKRWVINEICTKIAVSKLLKKGDIK